MRFVPLQPMLFPVTATRLLAAATPPAHGVPVLVWLVLALNVAVIGFFIYRIVGLLRERGEVSPPGAGSDAAPRREEP